MPSVQARSLESLPPPAAAAARELRDGLVSALGEHLQALYLYGAVTFPETDGATGLDYHAILARSPDAAQRAAVTAAETELGRHHPRYGAHLDGWFILLEDARRSAPPAHVLQPQLRDQAWALHRAHWLAGQCVILHGPDPAEIVPAPSRGELRAALNFELDYAARDSNDALAVLNACRIIRSATEDDVVQSKVGSAWWALEHLPAEYAPAIRAALASYQPDPAERDIAALASGRAAIIALAASQLGR